MILFKPQHADLILSGRKTQTRRIWRRQRAIVGSIHLAKTLMLSRDFFARLEILNVYKERLGDISDEDARAEGYPNRAAYLQAFRDINHDHIDLDQEVYVVKFRVVA